MGEEETREQGKRFGAGLENRLLGSDLNTDTASKRIWV
jgi:hypothetical protein